MTKIIIAHGIFGDKNEHWFPWLKTELEKLGHQVWCETLPTPESPQPEAWTQTLAQQLEPGSIVVGHSLGVPASLRALESSAVSLKAFYSVAGFVKTPMNEFTNLMRDFTDEPFDFMRLSQQCEQWHIWTADDDPYLGIAYSKDIINGLALAETEDKRLSWRVFPERNHLGTWEGSNGQFSELLDSIQNHL